MEFKVIGSSSAGNAYLLRSKKETLLIECGMPYKKIQQALDFKISNVSCLVSHSHGDHSNSIANILKAGIPVYSGKETLQAKGVLNHHRALVIEPGSMYKIGEFFVKPFPVNHDVPCLGFMIEHEEMGLLVFLTDTCYSSFTFPPANHYIVECNHDADILHNSGQHEFLKKRIINSHMNLETCTDLLLANDLRKVNNIVLIHLSDTNSDAKKFKRVIQAATGKTCTIASPGVVIDTFNLQPF